jgi:hypothetical protein
MGNNVLNVILDLNMMRFANLFVVIIVNHVQNHIHVTIVLNIMSMLINNVQAFIPLNWKIQSALILVMGQHK